MNYEKIFSKIFSKISKSENLGEIFSGIPELSNINPNKFGVHLTTTDNQHFSFGDFNEKFSIQSIAKVLSLTLAFKLENENLWKRVGVEPSGTPFNSLIQLESDSGIPKNPLINAGALVISDILVSHFKDPKTEFLNFVRKISNNPSINFSPKIAQSEKSNGFKNCALINLMKSYGNIKNDIEVVMDFYFNLCSIEMSCKELSNTFQYLATDIIDFETNEKIITTSMAKRINAIMWIL